MIDPEESAADNGLHLEAYPEDISGWEEYRESIAMRLLATGSVLAKKGEESIKEGDRATNVARAILREFCVKDRLDSK